MERNFWPNVEKTDTCWLWKGFRDPRKGYGKVTRKGGSQQAHRAAWAEATGVEAKPNELVCHTCDVRHCVRNDEAGVYTVDGIVYPRFGHLWLGTNDANMADMIAKGREARGETSGVSFLTNADIRMIRARYRRHSKDGDNTVDLAREYGMSSRSINAIVRRETWTHID